VVCAIYLTYSTLVNFSKL